MFQKEEKDESDEGPFSTDPGLTDVQERDLGLGGLFGWGREMTTGMCEAQSMRRNSQQFPVLNHFPK